LTMNVGPTYNPPSMRVVTAVLVQEIPRLACSINRDKTVNMWLEMRESCEIKGLP
jgi:hypothetical protein